MARRAGKAASRKARQRQVRRPAVASAPPPPAAAVVPPIGTPDAREAASLTPPRRTPAATTGLGSTLTDRQRAEYHYVERDLRNIGILTAILVILLLVAWAAFNALGLVR